MKLLKTLLVVALVAVNAAPAAAVTEITSAPEFVLSNVTLDVSDGCILLTKTWDINQSDEEVLLLTRFLKQQKYFKGTPTKKFTKSVKNALSKFQLEKGIVKNKTSDALGTVNAPTREHIAEATCKKRDIGTPATSCVFIARNLSVDSNALISKAPAIRQDILELQRFLVRKGYLSSTFITGIYSGLTKEAVIRFQYDNGIIASKTQDGAGIVGPKTREFIQLNTCGRADVARTTDPVRIGYAVNLTTRSGVLISENDSELVLRANITPQAQNAKVKSLVLHVQASTSTSPVNYIDGFELSFGGKLISRTRGANVWSAVAGKANTYAIRLSGSPDYLTMAKETALNIKAIPKSSALSGTPKEFKVYIPSDGLTLEFSNAAGVVRGDETWGRESGVSSFSVGKAPSTNATSTPTTSTSGTTTTTTTNPPTNTNTATVAKAPQLNWVRPDNGAFGEELVLRGLNFHSTRNQVKLVHVRTGATALIGGLASKNNQIHFSFPGKARKFERPNGVIITPNQVDMTGNYRIYVTSNGKQSNWILYKVNK